MKNMMKKMLCGAAALCLMASAAMAEFDAGKLIDVISREDGSGTRGAFVELTGVEQKIDGKKVDMTTEDAQITNNTAVMMTTVAGDPYAIGYISLGSLNDSVKAVKVAGVNATAENVKNGTYKVARPFNIAWKEDALSDAGRDFIAYILSSEGQAIVNANGYVGSSDAAAYEAAAVSGKVVVAGSSSVSPVMEKLAEAYMAVNAGVEIEIQTSDSTTGMTSAMEGSCEIGMASRELKEAEAAALASCAIAMDGIAVIVNNENPVDDLSLEQIAAVYTGETTAWNEL
ncbi:MAG: substrate-binding domain-containing protein [Candidatus Ventricola sp.]